MSGARRVPAIARHAAPLLLVAAVWEAAARLHLVSPIFVPALSTVIAALPGLVADGDILEPLGESLFRAAAGVAIAMAVGMTLGLLMDRVWWVKRAAEPFVAFGFPSPKVAFLPIFVLWFGIGDISKIALVAVTCVFPMVVAAEAGSRSVPRVQVWAARMMGTPPSRILLRIVVPAAMPSLMSGIRVAVPYALVTAFTAEMIAGGGGLGGGLVYAQRFMETTTVFALLLVMILAGYLIDFGLLLARSRWLRWHEG